MQLAPAALAAPAANKPAESKEDCLPTTQFSSSITTTYAAMQPLQLCCPAQLPDAFKCLCQERGTAAAL
jgi:hypothetical protein